VRRFTEVGRALVETFCESDVEMSRPDSSATRDRAELQVNGARSRSLGPCLVRAKLKL
jgi:hypothetical protein